MEGTARIPSHPAKPCAPSLIGRKSFPLCHRKAPEPQGGSCPSGLGDTRPVCEGSAEAWVCPAGGGPGCCPFPGPCEERKTGNMQGGAWGPDGTRMSSCGAQCSPCTQATSGCSSLLHCAPSHAALAAPLSCTCTRSPSRVPTLTLAHHLWGGPPSRSWFLAAPDRPASCPSLCWTDPAATAAARRDSPLLSLESRWLGAWGVGSVRCQRAAAHPAVQLVTALGRTLSGMRFAGDYFLDLSGQQRLGCPARANYSNKHLLLV